MVESKPKTVKEILLADRKNNPNREKRKIKEQQKKNKKLSKEMMEFVDTEAKKTKNTKEEKKVYEPKTLKQVHEVFRKWLYIKNFDFLHLAIATLLTAEKKGTPLWIIFIGASGDGKSETLRSFMKVQYADRVHYLDEFSDKTLASGAKNKKGKQVKDLGGELAEKSTVLITVDLASLTSKDKNKKREIWAKMRELFDGYISKETGNEVIRAYENCHVTWLFGATPAVKNEVLVFAELGTRELLFELPKSTKAETRKKMEKAWDNEETELEMRQEIREAMAGFISTVGYNQEYKISQEIKDWMFNEVVQLELVRATTAIDRKTNMPFADVSKAVPMRSLKQYKKLYRGFKSIDKSFPDEKIKEILHNMTISTANTTRVKILELCKQNKDKEFTFVDFENELKISKNATETQTHLLWNMGILSRDVREERIGEMVRNSGDGREWVTGGRVVSVSYFKLSKLWQQRLDDYIEW